MEVIIHKLTKCVLLRPRQLSVGVGALAAGSRRASGEQVKVHAHVSVLEMWFFSAVHKVMELPHVTDVEFCVLVDDIGAVCCLVPVLVLL